MKVRALHTQEWDRFFQWSEQCGGVFTSHAWLSCLGENIRLFVVENEQKWEAGFAAYVGGKLGVKTLITPPYTPHIGLFSEQKQKDGAKQLDYQKKILTAISIWLKSAPYAYFKLDLPTEWRDTQPFTWNKQTVTVRYTYQLELKKTEDELLTQMDSKLRNMINKAERDEMSLSFDYNEAALDQLILSFLGEKNIAHQSLLKQLLHNTNLSKKAIQVSIRKENKTSYTNYLMPDGEKMYYLFGAKSKEEVANHYGPLGVWEGIKKAKAQGFRLFDFEGSMIPTIEKFFRGFGGDLVPFYTISGGKGVWSFFFKRRYK